MFSIIIYLINTGLFKEAMVIQVNIHIHKEAILNSLEDKVVILISKLSKLTFEENIIHYPIYDIV
jgi:hypothetical protein